MEVGAGTALPLITSERQRLVQRAKLLAWLGIGWHGVEAGIALIAGVVAGSIALVGFGADSLIESVGWADPIAALLIAAVAVNEGREAWSGETCCAAPVVEADVFRDDRCD